MRTRLVVFLCLSGAMLGCRQSRQPFVAEWQNNPPLVNGEKEALDEIGVKQQKVATYMNDAGLDGILFTQVRNVFWATAGRANVQIVLNKDIGAAALLWLRNGEKYVLCSGSEADRLMDESLGKLGYKLLRYNWYEANPVKDVRADMIKSVAGKGKIGSDSPYPGTVPLGDGFRKLRYSMTETELERYRWLGRQTTEAVAEVCRAVEPGMDEFEIEAMTSAALRARGIMPTVLLIAVDDRISKYRHALPAGAVLKSYAMVNVVAEKWGMPMAVTRFVHFGPLPAGLAERFQKTARVNAHFEAVTVPGTACATIFELCKQWYAEAGFPDEWMKHHQGGAIGYDDREYVIVPGIAEVVQERQPFAWNPTITGAKVENTIIAFPDHAEVVTISDGWPMIDIELDGKTYHEPGALIR